MTTQRVLRLTGISRVLAAAASLAAAGVSFAPMQAQALPLFARQTGQNCMACHAGGQFPELTQYGRMFKLTGYTLGQRTNLPVSAMALLTRSSVNNTSKSTDPAGDFQKNDSVIFPTGSVFIGGKITDNIGAFTQITIDKYSTSADGSFVDQIGADNMDFRYADRFVSPGNDWIVGVSLNNNPSVSDPWNTAPAWMQYVPVPSPTSSSFIDGNAPYPGYAAGGNLAGITAYTYWNQTLYGEIGSYHTAKHLFHFMSAGSPGSDLKGFNPYWRLAYTKQWGAHYLMLGTSGMVTSAYLNDPTAPDHVRDIGLDAQYQFLLDPHSVTMQLAYMHERHRYPDSVANQPATYFDAAGNPLANTNAVDTSNILRAKLTYVYQAKYGGSLGFFNKTGSTNTAAQTVGYDSTGVITGSGVAGDNLSGNPGTRGVTYEAFWTPIQYARIGLQYTAYSKFNGASSNYNGFGRNASDNNSLFLYLWAAY